MSPLSDAQLASDGHLANVVVLQLVRHWPGRTLGELVNKQCHSLVSHCMTHWEVERRLAQLSGAGLLQAGPNRLCRSDRRLSAEWYPTGDSDA